VKQARNLHEVSFDQLYAYHKQNELDANEVRVMKARFPDPLALIANTYNPPPFYSRENQGYTGNAGRGRGSGATGVVRTDGDLNANPPKVIKCYNCREEGHYDKQCMAKKRVKDSEWFKEKMLLAQQQEGRIEIADEQQDFVADGL
ncbi:integrase, catalytic region, zinc finger, CCHC-type containing protein, partial [Tanacetum coccineum]